MYQGARSGGPGQKTQVGAPPVRREAVGPSGDSAEDRRPALVRTIATAVRRHWAMAALTVLAAGLLFTSLGRDYLWQDEADTAVLARSILTRGLPVAWDGVNLAVPDYGQRVTDKFVMVSHPWLQYYAAAASFALFGETRWAARLPFALAGLATIVLVYAMTLALLRNRLAAISAATLLTLSVQFLLFSRQARNYSFNAFLTCLLVWRFHRLSSWHEAALFAGIGILLFHAHPIGLAAVAALGLLTLVYRPFASRRRWFCWAALAIGLYVAPWLALSRSGYQWNTSPLTGLGELLPRLLQFAVEWASVTPAVGLVVLYLVFRARHRPPCWVNPGPARQARREGFFTPEERLFVAACATICLVEAVTIAVVQSRNGIWVVGLHHTPALIPLTIMMAGLLIAVVSGSSRKTWIALMLVFGFTRFAQIVPWTFWVEPVAAWRPDSVVTFHVPDRLLDRVLRTPQFHYVRSLARDNPGVIGRVSTFLRANAAPGDVVITNFAWEALYFHTGLPQGAKVSSSFPIYPTARGAKLPNYVFGHEEVRWIVWRRAWPAYFAEQDCGTILRQLTEAGMTAWVVQRIPETLYENRENLHFHRFAGGRYVYPWPEKLPDVLIYRVETPDEAAAHYRRELTRRPDDLEMLAGLGVALAVTGRIDEAIPVFRRAVDVAPNDGGSRRNLANALLDAGDALAASSHARRAVELRPQDPAAYDVLGRALAVLRRFDEARVQFELALKVDPGYTEAREHLERVRQARRR